jgi:hypothetical protein
LTLSRHGDTVGAMRTRDAAVLLLLSLPCATAAAAPAPQPRRWTVERLGLTFEMTATDLRAWKGEKADPPAFSVRALLAEDEKSSQKDAEERAAELLAPDAPELPTYELTAETTLDMLSVVGPLVSFQRSSSGFAPGAAHPYAGSRIETADVTRPGVTPSILDYVPEAAFVQALNADPWIQKFKDEKGRTSAAKTVKDLVEFLKNVPPPESDDCSTDAYFDEDMVQHFAFHHREGDRVAVRIGILYGAEVCRGTLHQVGLLLPAPAALRDDLARAERREAGFLMKDRKAVGSPSYATSFMVNIKELAARLKKSRP